MPFTSKTGKIAGKKSYEINKNKPEYEVYKKRQKKLGKEMAAGRTHDEKGRFIKK